LCFEGRTEDGGIIDVREVGEKWFGFDGVSRILFIGFLLIEEMV
jgi:hypothetical protein